LADGRRPLPALTLLDLSKIMDITIKQNIPQLIILLTTFVFNNTGAMIALALVTLKFDTVN
jgi:hypothetical protein